MSDTAPVDRRRRWAAAASLLAGVGAVLSVAVVLLGAPGALLLGLLGVVLAVGAGWFAVANRGVWRVVSTVVSLLGLFLLIWSLVSEARGQLAALVLAVGLGALSVSAARLATNRRVDSVTAADLDAPHPPARRGVLLMNPRSGGGKAAEKGLEEQCRARGIEPVVLAEGDDLVELAERALRDGADVIGMAGGDGSQALVAGVAHRAGVPFVVVPAGTRNHFALDLGLDRDDVVGALDAYTSPVSRRVDLARVNDRIFVNNASMGLYAEIVSSDAYRDAKLRTTLEALPDLLGPDAESVELVVTDGDGRERPGGQVVLISNNPYTFDSLGGLGTRAALDTGRLGVVSLHLATLADARQFLVLEAAHEPSRFRGWQEWRSARTEVRSDAAELPIALDGEALTMTPPLRFEILPRALTVLLPAHAPGRSPAARTLGWDTPSELWRIARARG